MSFLMEAEKSAEADCGRFCRYAYARHEWVGIGQTDTVQARWLPGFILITTLCLVCFFTGWRWMSLLFNMSNKGVVLAVDLPFDLTKQLSYKDDKVTNCIYTIILSFKTCHILFRHE